MKNGIVIISLLMFLTSCTGLMSEKKNGSGNVTKESKTVEAFNAIEVSSALDVFVTMGDKESIEVEADDNIHEHIKVEVKGETLKIYIESGFNLKQYNANIYVTAVNLERIGTSAASEVIVENTLKSETLNCNISSASQVNLKKVNIEDLNVQSSSAGNISIHGNAKEAVLNASSAGEINALDLEVAVCDANASSGGGIETHVTKSLTANASSGGEVAYKGAPERLNKTASSGGSVYKE